MIFPAFSNFFQLIEKFKKIEIISSTYFELLTNGAIVDLKLKEKKTFKLAE